jgi:Domain of unknown function (DUF4189)
MRGKLHAALRLLAVAAVLSAATVDAKAAGALAVGSCAAFGYSYDFAEEDAARSAALAKCSGRCTVVATMRRGCTAYAIDSRKPCGAHGYASAPTLGRAQNIALRQCYKFGGRDCMVRAWACDGKG